MKINSDLLIDSKVNGTFYANDFKCKNLLPRKGSTRINGITITEQSDGSLILNGTATNYVSYYYCGNDTTYLSFDGLENGGKFTLSSTSVDGYFIYILKSGGTVIASLNDGGNTTFTTSANETYRIFIRVNSGTTLNNIHIYPQLEIGDEATPYTPYKAFENINIPISNILYDDTTTLDTFFNSLLKCTLKYTTDGAYSVLDSTTKIYQLERNGFYLFIDSHPYNNSVGIINGFNGNVKNIIETSGHLVFTYNSSNYQMTVRTINGARFKLYKIEGQGNV